jgi:predicted dithiol-disulfide oxidoreductase (DUF899 family)
MGNALTTQDREEWLAARKHLLALEKEFTHQYDALTAKQRSLPWLRIDKEYLFDSPSGKVTLAQLFNGRSQLFIKHFMMGPGTKHQCVGCSLEVDHVEGILEHLKNHKGREIKSPKTSFMVCLSAVVVGAMQGYRMAL